MSATPYRSATLIAPTPLELLAGRQLLGWGVLMLAIGYVGRGILPSTSPAFGLACMEVLPLGGIAVGAFAAARLQRVLVATQRLVALLALGLFSVSFVASAAYRFFPNIEIIPGFSLTDIVFHRLNVLPLLGAFVATLILTPLSATLPRSEKALYTLAGIGTLIATGCELVGIKFSDPADRILANDVAASVFPLTYAFLVTLCRTPLKLPVNRAEFEAIAQSADGLAIRANALKRLSMSATVMILSLTGSISLALMIETRENAHGLNMQVRAAGLILAAVCLLISFRSINQLHRWSSHIPGVTTSFVLLLAALSGALVTFSSWESAMRENFAAFARTYAFAQQGMTEVLVLATLMSLTVACAKTSPTLSKIFAKIVFASSVCLGLLIFGVHQQCPDYVMRTAFQRGWVYTTLVIATASVLASAALFWRAANGLLPKNAVSPPPTL